MVDYFKKEYAIDNLSFLLVLTQNVPAFEQLVQQLDKQSYCIVTVKHDEIYRYLSAGDIGMLFREPHIINWISRPTKVLEYQAVGLQIVHNNTVALLTDSSDQ